MGLALLLVGRCVGCPDQGRGEVEGRRCLGGVAGVEKQGHGSVETLTWKAVC